MHASGAFAAFCASFLLLAGATDGFHPSVDGTSVPCPFKDAKWFGVLVGNFTKALRPSGGGRLDVSRLRYSNLLAYCQGKAKGERSAATEIVRPSAERFRIRPLPCLSQGVVWMAHCGLWESVSRLRENVYSYEEPFRVRWDDGCGTEECRSRSHPFGPFLFLRAAETDERAIRCSYQHSPVNPRLSRSIAAPAASETARRTPVLLVPKSNLTALRPSAQLLLTCVDDSEVVWLRNGKAIESGARFKVSRFSLGQHLFARSLAPFDSGVFQCRRRGLPGSQVNVSVAVEAEVRVPPTGTALKCCAGEGRAPLRFRWLLRGAPVSHGRVQETGSCSILRLARLKRNESGRYRCQVNAVPGPRFKVIPEEWLLWPWTPSLSFRDLRAFNVLRAVGNEFAPRITLSQPSKDGRIQVDLASSDGVIATVLVADDDEDKEGPGRVATCRVACDRPQCPEFSVLQRRSDGSLVGRITDSGAAIDDLRLRILCSDAGLAPKTATKEVVVSRCSQCAQGDAATTERLVGLLANATQPDAVVQKLRNITTRPEALTSFQVELSVMATSAALDSLSRVDEEEKMAVLEGATNVISNCLRLNETVLEDGAPRIVETVSQLTAAIPLSENRSRVVIAEAGLAVAATTVDRSQPGFVRFVVPPGQGEESAVISGDEALPASVAVSVRKSEVAGDRVDFSFFSSARIFPAEDAGVSVVSPVIAARADLQPSALDDDEDPVQLVFNASAAAHATCAFWNATAAAWGSDGCSQRAEGHAVRCSCSHLTNFALIIRVDASPLARGHQRALSHLSRALLVVSIVALGLTCYVYVSYVRQKQRDKRSGQRSVEASIQSSRAHICFSATLMLFLAFFLVTGGVRGSASGCAAIGALNHLLLLSVFAWSVVEGVQICSSIIHVAMQSGMVTHNVRMFTILSMSLGWGIPTALVVLTLLVTKAKAYGALEHPGSFCFFKDTLAMHLAFLLPICLALLTNLVIIAMLVYVLKYRMGLGNVKKKKQERSKRKLFGFFGVLVVLNVTWLVGLLNFGAVKAFMSYLFVILNGLQGLFVFLCYCIFQMEVRKHMRKSMACFKWMPEVDERSTSASDARFLTENSQSVAYSSRKESISLPRRRQ